MFIVDDISALAEVESKVQRERGQLSGTDSAEKILKTFLSPLLLNSSFRIGSHLEHEQFI